MLMQNFKSADELGISEPQADALRKTLVLLETGKLRHVSFRELGDHVRRDFIFSGQFNMSTYGYSHACGTAACIGGTAELISDAKFIGVDRPNALTELFYMDSVDNQDMDDVTPAQAARALRSYLTCGDAKWSEAVA